MGLERERETLSKMIRLYCRHQHQADALCDECAKLLAYAEQRLDTCPFGEDKPTCQRCEIHCYTPKMRKRITEVMRFSGPRMAVRHPVAAIRHFLKR